VGKMVRLFLSVILILALATGIAIAAAPKDVLVYGCNQIVRSLDPIKAICWEEKSLEFSMYDTLLGYEPTRVSELKARLAERWEVSEDGRTWTFYLRKGIKFTTGNPLSADDVVFSLTRGVKANYPCYPPISRYMDIDTGFKVIDKYTIQMKLKVPYAGFGQLLTGIWTGIVDSRTVKAHITKDDPTASNYLGENSIGTGPLKLMEWKRGQKIVLVANPSYWGKKIGFRVPKYKQLIDLHVPEPSAQNMMLDRGDIDMAFDLTAEMISKYEKDANSSVKIERVPIFIGTGIVMNTSRGIFQDPKVRRAIRYAIEYNTIIKDILNGNAIRLDRPIFQPFIGVNNGKDFLYDYNLEKAKQLMKESKYPDGGSFTLVIGNGAGFGAPWDVIALKEAQDLEKIGIKVKLEQYDWSAVDEKQFNGNYDALQMWFTIPFPETEGMMMGMGHTAESTWLKPNSYRSKQIDSLIEKATVEPNLNKRTALYNEISNLYEEDGPYAFVAQQKKPFVFGKNLFGFDRSPDATQIDFTALNKK
jgi:peptide/nickel transport system substrate-binding protein